MRQALRNLLGSVPKRHLLTRTDGTLHFELVAIVIVRALHRFNHQEVQRKPDRTSPIGVPAEEVAGGFGGLVIHGLSVSIQGEDEGIVLVKFRERTGYGGRQEFIFMKRISVDPFE